MATAGVGTLQSLTTRPLHTQQPVLKIGLYGTCKNRVLEDGLAIQNRRGEASPSTHRQLILTSSGAYDDTPRK